MKIWSLRTSPVRGNHFVDERDCAEDTVQAWLAIFRKDEPNVIFIASARKPPIRTANNR